MFIVYAYPLSGKREINKRCSADGAPSEDFWIPEGLKAQILFAFLYHQWSRYSSGREEKQPRITQPGLWPQPKRRKGVTPWARVMGSNHPIARSWSHALISFLQAHQDKIKGVSSGFDRIRFRGALRFLANARGLKANLWQTQVLLEDFKDFALGLTDSVRSSTQQLAEAAGSPVVDLTSSSQRKEEPRPAIASADGVSQGLIDVLGCVEPCLAARLGCFIVRCCCNRWLRRQSLRARCRSWPDRPEHLVESTPGR